MNPLVPENLSALVRDVVERTPVYDMHTHLYDPAFGELLLWGIDDLLTYHYLIAEGFRSLDLPAERFWALPKTEQAALIWNALFIERSPLSEACRGVLTVLQALGIDARARDLPALRQHFGKWTAADFTTRVMEKATVRQVCMTNSPFDDSERAVWDRGFERDPRFRAALRLDPLLLDWPNTAPLLRAWGYDVSAELNPRTFDGVRRFLSDWTSRIDAQYCMVSLPPDFGFFQVPVAGAAAQIDDDEAAVGTSYRRATCNLLIEHAIMPHGREHGQAFAMMIGVRRAVNPQLRLAGDSVGLADVESVERLCAAFPENRFLCTMLARENQHALCVAARKFRNLHLFGCWWFLNTPSLIEEITTMRLELLGPTFTPQHSDARVLDQLIYKWAHIREVLATVLTGKYAALSRTGWQPSRREIERDVHALLGGGALGEFLK